MSGRRLIAAGAAALLLPTAALMTTQASSAYVEPSVSAVDQSAPAVAARAAKTKISIQVLPQIAQYGKRPASANAAKAPVLVSVKPRKKNTVVTLQSSTGSSWKKAGKAKTDKAGKVRFLAAASKGGKALNYRAVVGKASSPVVNTAAWVKPSFSDEFAGKSLSGAWEHRVPDYNPAGNRYCSRGGSQAVSVSKGTARISVIKDPARSDKCAAKRNGKVTGRFAYRLNGHISTMNAYSFTYGVAAARIKFPATQGQHGSFWMQPTTSYPKSYSPLDAGAEIDVIEYFGPKSGPKSAMGLTCFTYHWSSTGQRIKTGNWIKGTKNYLANKKDDWFKAYHVFSVEWTPSAYIFRIDGQETWRSTVGISGQPQFAILSLLSSDYELDHLGSEKKLPQHMYVDWIRVWDN